MHKSLLLTCLLSLLPLTAVADETSLDLSTIDRSITREPAYEHPPHYALFVFGPRGEDRAWLVLDGDRVAYIDRNGDGDLTDPEERVPYDAQASEKLKFSNAIVWVRGQVDAGHTAHRQARRAAAAAGRARPGDAAGSRASQDCPFSKEPASRRQASCTRAVACSVWPGASFAIRTAASLRSTSSTSGNS